MTKFLFVTSPAVTVMPTVPVSQWPISEQGMKQIGALAQQPFWPTIAAVYASTDTRSYTAADYLCAKHGISCEMVDDLREINRDSTGCLPLDEYVALIKQFYASPETSVRGWEPAQRAQERIVRSVSQLMDRHREETIAIIGHGGVGTLLACAIEGVPATYERDPKTAGKLLEVDWENRRILHWWEPYGELSQEMRREIVGQRPR